MSNDEKEKQAIRKLLKHIRSEIVYVKNYFDDSDRFKNYLYYLHGLFSKLEILMINFERKEQKNEK